ncbi:MAG: beta-lactamase family protein [Parachlamydiaceae bacterium]|nr:beta-lactamase family protein [Parachlamydiaceae bacterium]
MFIILQLLFIILGVPESLFCEQYPCAIPASFSNASSTSINNISPVLESIVKEYGVPGMVAAVISSDMVISVGAAGLRSASSSNKATVNDQFHIGSDIKSMTATLMAILIDKGYLKWNSKVIDVFPDLKGKIDPKYNSLDLEQLLTHRGGVNPDINYDKIQKIAGSDLVKARQLAMEKVLSQPPGVASGEYQYSNMGYVIAGHMAEKVTGRMWEDLLTNYLFLPLRMQSAGFGPPKNGVLEQPVGHNEEGKPLGDGPSADNPQTIGPAGTVHLTILDWAKYIMMHLRGARGNNCLLSKSFFEKLHTSISNPPPAYAMGWMVVSPKWADGNVLVHAGSNTYWLAKVWIAPKKDLAILVACNKGGKDGQAACNQAGLILMQNQLNLPHVKSIDPTH